MYVYGDTDDTVSSEGFVGINYMRGYKRQTNAREGCRSTHVEHTDKTMYLHSFAHVSAK